MQWLILFCLALPENKKHYPNEIVLQCLIRTLSLILLLVIIIQ